MKLRAIQTGSVRIKTAQVQGRGHGLRRRLGVFADRDWTGWLPTYAWVIDHPEGVIVVDTGQGTHLLESARSLHPYRRWEVMFRIEPDEEIGPQLRAHGIGPRDVKRVVLTHLHIDLADEPFGPFATSRRLTKAGDVVAVATPGHTADHLSVIVEDRGITYFLAGDTSYNERLMLAGQIDGVCADDDMARATLRAIRDLARDRSTVYLPTHDPESAARLSTHRVEPLEDGMAERPPTGSPGFKAGRTPWPTPERAGR